MIWWGAQDFRLERPKVLHRGFEPPLTLLESAALPIELMELGAPEGFYPLLLSPFTEARYLADGFQRQAPELPGRRMIWLGDQGHLLAHEGQGRQPSR